MQSEELVEKVAKALALEMYPDTRWPRDEADADYGAGDSEHRHPVSWHYAQICRRQAKVAIAALSAQVQDESEIVDCLLAGKPFVFDPATNFCHADDGGAPEHGIKYVPAAQVQDVAVLPAEYYSDDPAKLKQLLAQRDKWLVDNDHWHDFTRSLPAAPAKQEG